ncbi:MAG: S-layer homology domain-containing protein [Bryobacteraceae bacterium]|nr:S-layer homology domain-containing protein [Bryobacteraceae bacterium]MDW8377435.1 S-layer homology domain-containing protein [Bryobacterales bacterium]
MIRYQPNDRNDRSLPFRLTEFAPLASGSPGKALERPIASCHVDDGQLELVGQSSATVMILYPDVVLAQPVWLTCTGTYVTDRLATNRHYVITAHHCLHRPEQAQTAQFYWSRFGERFSLWSWPASQITSGAILRKTVVEAEGDASLLELFQAPPEFVSPIRINPDELPLGAPTFTFHHPDSSWMRFTSGDHVAPIRGVETGIVINSQFRPSDYYYKITEPVGLTDYGSSGAGLRSERGLFGVLSYGPPVSCDPQGRHGVYGRISTFLPRVQDRLWNNSAGSCSISPLASNITVGPAGTHGAFPIQAPSECRWAVAADSEHILVSPKSGSGNALITFQVLPNGQFEERLGTVSVISEQRRVIHYAQVGTSSAPLYRDVPATHLFFPHIQFLRRREITAYGCPEPNAYCPDGRMTRGQMAEFMIKSLLGSQFTFDWKPAFLDVPETHPAFPYVQKMKELRITDGCTATSYCPDEPVTRGQMAAFIIRAWNVKNGRDSRASFEFQSQPYFTDTPPSNIFFSAIQKMKELGITSGCTLTEYCPNNPNTRGEIAVFLSRGVFALWEGRPQ